MTSLVGAQSNDAAMAVLLLVAVVGGLIFGIYLLFLPGKIARERNHPSAEAINVCSFFSVILWPLWLVAIIWAHSVPKPARRITNVRRGFPVDQPLNDPIPAGWGRATVDDEVAAALGEMTPPPPSAAVTHAETPLSYDDLCASVASADGPGVYVINGVDKATKMDTTWRVRAASRANAKVKAELEGIVVTSIEKT